ncbi:hypothetical protein [Flagellimonas myxillae]|uniref:hypothetical protein n=1 Tax=Flagellimonas myxillae TaxID=2942214 RepID=UPI00201F306D|nr:hypothetical protein [Muricauda myxillae]MCL6266604.1 hypothetical protein [Muricauda myxillae]
MRGWPWFILILFLGWSLHGQELPAIGKVHDSIVVDGDPNETFALYLPNSFSKKIPSSIVFVFDPAARGAVGVQTFIPAAEKYGHILVCSNNSRNAPYERNFEIANRLFNHIFAHFNIDEDSIYATGFSGGARLATAIASLTDKFAGVIGCGAGFSGIREYMPGAQRYAYVGLCGDRDMNYKEMLENKGYLNLIQFNGTLVTYDGEHRWPPETQILRAFDWLQLQKLKKERPVPMAQIQRAYQRDSELLMQFREEGSLLFEAEQHERMVKDYAGILEVDSLKVQYAALLNSKVLKQQLEAVETALEKEREWVGKLDTQLQRDLMIPDKTNWNWWKKELGKLEKLKDKGGQEMQKMVFRIRFDLFVRAYSRKNELLHQQSTAQSKWIDTLLELLNPK